MSILKHYGILEDSAWYIFKVKFKTEKLVGKYLSNEGFEIFLPMLKITKRYNRKIRVTEKPLLYQYLFVKCSIKNYLTILKHEYVLGFVRVGLEKVTPVSEDELDILRRIVEIDPVKVSIEESQAEPGDMVEVVKGQLFGLTGKMVDRHGKKQLKVEINCIDQSIFVIIDEDQIRKV